MIGMGVISSHTITVKLLTLVELIKKKIEQ
nr:MAG TPA: hypothetical protein [Herelleviridae sp.]